MNESELVQRLEIATHTSLAPPDQVTPASRQEAEEILLAFRKSKAPYHICRKILELSTVPSVQYQAVATLKEGLIRDWHTLDEATRINMQQFILSYITERPNITGFVREALSNVLAVMVKRASISEHNPSQRMPFYQHLTKMISSGNPLMEKSACSILSAMCSEFSASDKSSSVGITWEQHIKCKHSFEANDLQHIFDLVLQVLQHADASSTGGPLQETHAGLCEKFFIIAEQILNWQFTPANYGRRYYLALDSTAKVAFKPPKQWKDILLNPSLLEMFFKIHMKVRQNETLCHGSVSCLVQLASLNGPVFEQDQASCTYLLHYVQAFLHVFSNYNCIEHEVLGISNIVKNLVEMHAIDDWATLAKQSDVFNQFLQLDTKMTCLFGKEASQEEGLHEDDQIYIEAYENMLDSWTTFMESMSDRDKSLFISPCAIQIFTCYVQSHLSPPDGARVPGDGDDSDVDELEEDDATKFRGQIISVASLARTVPHQAIPMLTKLLEERTSRLNGQIQRIKQRLNASEPVEGQDSLLNDLFEDLHWLVLLTGHVLADECEGETPLIPPDLVAYSIGQKSSINEAVSLQVLGSPKQRVSEIPGAENSTDHIVRLTSAVIRLSQVESDVIAGHSVELFSPELSKDIMWFLKTWSSTYLLYKEDYYKELSPVLSSAFGRNSQGAKWLVNFLISKIYLSLCVWTGEKEVLENTTALLFNLVDQSERCNLVAECQDFWKLGKNFCLNQHPFNCLPYTAKQSVMASLVLAGSAKMNVYRDQYWQQTLQPLPQRYKQLVSKEGFAQSVSNKEVQSELSDILNLLQGVAMSSRPDNASILFSYLSPITADCGHLMDIFHNFENIVIAILELLIEMAHKQMCYLSKNQCRLMYEWSLSVLQTYSKHNLHKHSREAEEEAFQDLSLIIELLTHILSKDFIDFSETDTDQQAQVMISPAENEISAADVVIFGLKIILPHMNSQLLLYPTLCSQYYKLLTFMCEIFPEKIETMPLDILRPTVHSLQVGFSAYGNDNCKLCLEAVESLAIHCMKNKDKPSELHAATSSFFRLVFDTLVVHSNDFELLRSAGDTFYSLLCFQPDQGMMLFTEIVASQSDPDCKNRLTAAFHALVPDIVRLVSDRSHRKTFLKTLESVIFEIGGILCVK